MDPPTGDESGPTILAVDATEPVAPFVERGAAEGQGGEGLSPGACVASQPPSVERPHDMRLYRPSNVQFDPRRLQLPDDFYAPTTADVQKSFASLSGTTHSLNNAPLMTKKMRDSEQARKMSRFRKVLIRVRLPDRTALQGTFTPSSTVRDVVKFVNSALRNPKAVKFNLFVTPPKTILKDLDATLWSRGLVPAALVNLGIETGPSDSAELLRDEVLGLLEDVPVQGESVLSTTAPPVAAESTGKGPIAGRSTGAASGSKKVPAWLMKGKKK
jgi:tether containing UBX domain for GLUT4